MDLGRSPPSFYGQIDCVLLGFGLRELPSASGVFAEGAADGEETYIYALSFELLAHHKASLV